MKRLGTAILSILISIVVLLSIVEIMVRWDNFFERQYIENQVAFTTQIELDELMAITDEIQDYLLGNRTDFNIGGTVDSTYQEVFNEREIVHMEDVKVLFDRGLIIRNISFILMIILGATFWIKSRKSLYNSMIYSSISFITIGTALILLLVSNFNKYFNIFHEIFFDNDYWILDPSNSVLINMVPLNFFISITAYILIGSFSTMLLIGILGSRLKRNEEK